MRLPILFFASIIGATSLPAFARGNVEAVQLDLVPLDVSVPCNRNFFRSSSHFKGTVFMTPRVVSSAGNDPNVKNSYAIIPTPKKDEFRLDVYLFFPQSDEQLTPFGASSQKRDTDACNVDAVKHALNEFISDESQQVNIVARIPLTSIDVTIPGIDSIGRIGRLADGKEGDQAVDFLTYNNHVLAASFLINKAEKQYFLSRVRDGAGLPAQVTFRLQGRQRDGSIHAEINVGNLQASFMTAVEGKVSLARVDAKIALRAAMSSSSISITSEAGDSDASNKASEMIIEKIFKEISLEIDKLPEVDGKAEKEDKEEKGGKGGKEKSDSGKVSVKAVLDILATSDKRVIDTNFMTVQVEATDQDEIRIRATDARDSNVLEIDVKADYLDPSTGVILDKGQTIAITPASWRVDDIFYDDVYSEYLTSSQLNELDLAQDFPLLLDRSTTIEDREFNGTLLAVGRHANLVNYVGGEYRWKRVRYLPRRKAKESGLISPSFEGLKDIPVALSFSKIGRAYRRTLAGLFVANDWWEATYDSQVGQILLTAKRDLGLVQFREMMGEGHGVKSMSTPLVMDKVVMEYTDNLFSSYNSAVETVVAQDRRAFIEQKVFSFSVVVPDLESVQDIVPEAPESAIVPRVP